METAAMWRVFSEAGGVAISALWQGAALALGLALCLRLMPRMSAADRFRIWAAGFAALVLLPFLPGLFSSIPPVFGAHAASGALPPVSALPAAHPWLDLDPRWSLAIATAWLAASLARAIDLGAHALRLRRLWKRAVPVEAAGFTGIPEGAGAKIEVCTTRDLDRPGVIGFHRPRILIPHWLLERLTPAELEQVVLHEAEHLRRRDDWINLAQKLCLLVFPLNPALAWTEHRLCCEREMACDEAVVRRTQSPRAYAACLAGLAERRFERERGLKRRAEALSLGAWRRRPELASRVHRILRRGPGMHPAAARALVGLAGCGLLLGSVELARCPQLAAFTAPERPLTAGIAGRAGEVRMVNTAYMADGQALSRFRAVDAVAHAPGRSGLARGRRLNAAPMRRSSAPAAAKARQNNALNHLGPAQSSPVAGSVEDVALIQTMPGGQGAPHWIVFTAWEQVETATPGTNPTRQTIRQYTIARLVFDVPTASEAKRSAGNAATGPTGTTKPSTAKAVPAPIGISITPLPAAIPIRDGWLVFQL